MAFESKRNLRPPAVVPLKKLAGRGYDLTRVQDNVEAATKDSRSYEPTRGRVITVTATGAGAVTAAHGLGRKPTGMHIEGKDTTSEDLRLDLSASDSRNASFDASGAAVFTVRIF